ncbi:MAG: peroxiredoxin [Cyanobacteriota bacterium]|nr:peroxiredoxin [Cyanobacteriota bacterium]
MQRRDLLKGFAAAASTSLLAPICLLGKPRQAFALGGTLPELDAPAPPFRLEGIAPAKGKAVEAAVALEDFAGQWLVLYFYPKDFTGGCTLEARGFQKDLASFQAANAAVVGVSADDPDSHASFCSEEGLAFPLLSDPGGDVSRRYGSWIPPFSQRHTFLIDPQGVLRQRWVAVRPTGHSTEVLAELQRQQNLIA